jgi:hypothetical protein
MKNRTAIGAVMAASLMVFGAAAQAQSAAPTGDLDRDGVQNRYDNDRDGDGIANKSDPQPNVFNRTRVAPRANDMDGDGIANARDSQPNVPNRRQVARTGPNGDLDRDGVLNRRDRDRDGDGIANARDRYPENRRLS